MFDVTSANDDNPINETLFRLQQQQQASWSTQIQQQTATAEDEETKEELESDNDDKATPAFVVDAGAIDNCSDYAESTKSHEGEHNKVDNFNDDEEEEMVPQRLVDEDEEEDLREIAAMNECETGNSDSSPKSTGTSEASPKSKRKQYQPQQMKGLAAAGGCSDDETAESIADETLAPTRKRPKSDEVIVATPPTMLASSAAAATTMGPLSAPVQEYVNLQKKWYCDWLLQQRRNLISNSSKPEAGQSPNLTAATASTTTTAAPPTTTAAKEAKTADEAKTTSETKQTDLKSLGQSLKTELSANLTTTVDKIIQEYIKMESARLAAQQQLRAAALAAQQKEQQKQQQQQQAFGNVSGYGSMTPAIRPFYMNPFYSAFPYSLAAAAAATGGANAQLASANSIFPNGPLGAFGAAAAAAGLGGQWPGLQQQSSAGSTSNGNTNAIMSKRVDQLLDSFTYLPRKKRSKVTDTRPNKLPMRSESVNGGISRASPMGAAPSAGGGGAVQKADGVQPPALPSFFPPTMVGHPLYGGVAFGPGLPTSSIDSRDRPNISPNNSDDFSDYAAFDSSMHSHKSAQLLLLLVSCLHVRPLYVFPAVIRH